MLDLDAIADEEAAKAKKSGPPCWVCSIPEREWIEKAKREGRSTTVVVNTLVRSGLPREKATRHRIEYHVANHSK